MSAHSPIRATPSHIMRTHPSSLPFRRMASLAVCVLAYLSISPLQAAYWNQNQSQTQSQNRDLDGDGIPNIVDPDIDNDGIPNIVDHNVDGGIALTGPYAGQYLGDHIDNDNPTEEDIDDDGLADVSLAEKDIDGDSKNDDDSTEIDIDGDGRSNNNSTDIDIDGDGIRNDDPSDDDDDGDDIDDLDDDDDNNDGVKDIDDDNHHPETEEGEVSVELSAEPSAPSEASVKLSLQHYGTGDIKCVIDARDLGVGNYEFIVDGVPRGTLAVAQESSHTRGLLVFKSTGSSGGLLLDFPIAEQSVAIRQGVTDYFTGTAPVLPGPGEGDDSITLFKGPSAPSGSQAEVSMHFGANGPTTLEVQIEDVTTGDYTLLIGDDVRGTIHVTGTPGDTQGHLHFEIGGSGSSLPLDFPCAGQPIAVTQGGATYFFGQLPSAMP